MTREPYIQELAAKFTQSSGPSYDEIYSDLLRLVQHIRLKARLMGICDGYEAATPEKVETLADSKLHVVVEWLRERYDNCVRIAAQGRHTSKQRMLSPPSKSRGGENDGLDGIAE